MALTTNLAAYYKLDGNSNDSVASLNGTDTSVSYSTGKINQGLVLSGDPSKVAITSGAAVNNWTTFSINLWFKTGGAMGQFTRIIEKGTNNEIAIIINYVASSGKVSLQGIGGNSAALTSASTVNDGAWHMLTATINSDYTACKLYIDGSTTLGATGSAAGSIPVKTGNISIGCYGGGGFNWQGSIDEVGIWTKELTAAEVTLLYNSGIGLSYPFAYTNDTKPSGSYTDDSNLTKVKWGDAFYTWGSSIALWGNGSLYSGDTKPSGSYSNDTKPT